MTRGVVILVLVAICSVGGQQRRQRLVRQQGQQMFGLSGSGLGGSGLGGSGLGGSGLGGSGLGGSSLGGSGMRDLRRQELIAQRIQGSESIDEYTQFPL